MNFFYTLFFLLITPICFAQNTPASTNTEGENKENAIGVQFDELFRKSTKYQDYKVIKITTYLQLKNNVQDSLNAQQKIINTKENSILKNRTKIVSLNKQLAKTQEDLAAAIALKNTRSIFGFSVNNSVFSVFLGITYSALIVLLGFFIFKYNQNLSTTHKAISDLENLEKDYEKHKKNSLRRFQEVNRKLQDELNKNWKKEK